MINLLKYIAGACLIVLSQVLVFNRVEIGYGVYIMIYPLFLLILPFRMHLAQVMIIAFLIGISIDFFLNTYGLHASSLVFAAYLRPFVFKIIAPNEDYSRGDNSDKYTSASRFFLILLLFMLVHHLWFFLMESFNLGELLFTFMRIGLSTVASAFIAFFIFLLFLLKTRTER